MATSYSSQDALHAYLFECGDDALFAVSLDPRGSNIPTHYCREGWTLREEFALGVDEIDASRNRTGASHPGHQEHRLLRVAPGQEGRTLVSPRRNRLRSQLWMEPFGSAVHVLECGD